MPGDRLEAGARISIAESLAELLQQGPRQPLDRVANGTQVPSDENVQVAWVWTGTKSDGTVDSQMCTSWTNAVCTGADWTNLGGRTCDVKRRFYCFQK